MAENSRRSAHATVRGYLYQTCLGVLRWLDLQPNEVLVCEGDEDLDRHLLGGTVISEQVKAYSGRLGLGDQAVLESLFNFLRTYVALRREDQDRKFIFTTTAEPRTQRKTGLDFDLLEKWRAGIRNRKVISAVRSLLKPKKENTHRKEIEEARAWLDEQPEGWVGFMNAVEWTFKAPDLDEIRRTIQSRLARGEKSRNLDADLFTDRLVVHVLEASSQTDINARTLTRAALSKLVEEDLNRWANSQRGRRIREAFDEVARIQDLLNTGTDKLRDLKPGTLLTAAHEVIPFDEAGRQEELELLANWCQEDEPRSVLLLTGEGGSGKTRLMIEWCRRLRHQGWHAGFLRRDRQAGELDPLLKGAAPRLVVVDYAETQRAVVQPLLQKLASAESGTGPKVRVVLLSRREGDWWHKPSEEDGEIARLPKRSQAISPLIPSEIEARQEAFRRAMEGFAAQQDRSAPERVPPPDFSGRDFERVLLIHMAALAALDGTRIGNATEALQATLAHERRFWKKQVAGLGTPGDLTPLLDNALEIAVTAVTLAQGCPTEQETEALLPRVLRHLPLQAQHPGTVRDLLRNLYDGSGGDNRRYLDPLQPDLLGEELVAQTLTRDTGLIGRILEQCSPREAYFTLVVLSRLVRRIHQAEEWIRILAQELEGKGTPEIWQTLQQLCDEREYQNSVPLREIAFIATKENLRLLRERSDQLSEAEQAEHARLLNNLGSRLSDLGRREEALNATHEAVEIYRRLAQQRPDAFTPDLATSLNNLGIRYSALGLREEALNATHEAVEIYRRLAQQRPDAFTPDLATSLNNLGNMYSDLGRREEALNATHEAVRSLSPFFLRFPAAFASWMATMARNYFQHAEAAGQEPDEALLTPILEVFQTLNPDQPTEE